MTLVCLMMQGMINWVLHGKKSKGSFNKGTIKIDETTLSALSKVLHKI